RKRRLEYSMAIFGVGTDIVHLPRIAGLLHRRSSERFASRILSSKELPFWRAIQSSTEKTRFLAVRWCVKEATYKALQPKLPVQWKDISFLADSSSGSRKPLLEISQSNLKLHSSVSHDGDYVIAMVIVEST
ncbi:hypothetical protein M422DRAFT_166557, partial [Sphaerobolus stellatus SS14]